MLRVQPRRDADLPPALPRCSRRAWPCAGLPPRSCPRTPDRAAGALTGSLRGRDVLAGAFVSCRSTRGD